MSVEIMQATATQKIKAGDVVTPDMAIMDLPVSKIKPTPVIGQRIWIKHQVKRTSDGQVLGMQRRDKPAEKTISAVYMDGTVRTGISDVWEVRPSTSNTWETVNPYHGTAE